MKKMTIENFKLFSEKALIEFGKITANTGVNSKGKSTLIQAILLVRQVYESHEINVYSGNPEITFGALSLSDGNSSSAKVHLNDSYGLNLGFAKDIMPKKGVITVALDEEIPKNACIYKFSAGNTGLTLDYRYNSPNEFENVDLGINGFYYLNAEREGPRDYQNRNIKTGRLCGYRGEHTIDILASMSEDPIESNRVLYKQSDSSATEIGTLEKQAQDWLNYITPGVGLRSSLDKELRIAKVQFAQSEFDSGFHSPNNFGFGLSYVLPIIVTGLLANKKSVFIVENPEAHLHPSGQSRIGRFLSKISQDGVQVIVETHSEHVINGIRLQSLKDNVNPRDVCINYFTGKPEDGYVKRIGLNEDMDFTEWPDGFFDQEEKDFRELRELRRAKKK